MDFDRAAICHLYNSIRVFSFDFDGTLNNSYYTNGNFNEDLSPKQEMLDLLKSMKEKEFIVYILTSRSNEKMKAVYDFVSKYELDVDGVISTDGELKAEYLIKLGVQVHFDDSLEEVRNNYLRGIKTYHVQSKI